MAAESSGLQLRKRVLALSRQSRGFSKSQLSIVANVKVKIPVAVQVCKRRRRGPIPVATQTGAVGDVLERSIALVAIKAHTNASA